MSLQRSATRKGGPGPTKDKDKKDYSVVEQAMKQLYPPEKQNASPDLDIVLVPGLGAHPEESWKSESTQFNWTTEALVKDFPKSRVLLYKYQSAWRGSLKVKQFMANVAMAMLTGLQSVRKNCPRRPIVFIGHSMGGLVIAKAITVADQRRDKFPIMFEAIAAAIFFGTPFGGAPVASVAVMYAHVAEKMGQATSSKLLDLMKEGDEGLRELKHEFMRLVGKLSPKIELFCFYEEQPTDFSEIAGLPALFGLSKAVIPKKYAEFVSRDSATLPGVDELGLVCNHRDLVKFHGHRDTRWSQFVREPVRKIIHGAQLSVKNRLNSVRDIDRDMISKIMEALEGAQVQKKRNTLRQTYAPSSWITTEVEYAQWLAEGTEDLEMAQLRNRDCLWIRGPEGRGKTSASMAAVEEIEKHIIKSGEEDNSDDPVLLACFFCDSNPDYNTAEDVLKSLIRQLINQQVTLAAYAKQYVKKSANEGSKSQARAAVENLWATLQEMLMDEFIGRKVIFVLNNIHCLPELSDSTIKLMNYLSAEVQGLNNDRRVPTRWFITSRDAHNVDEALKSDGVRLVDLEDEKYGNQVQNALRKHAKQKVSVLEQSKNYNKALAYFASSLIGRRAQNTQWIDITCVQLAGMPETQSDLPVRRALETMPQDLRSMLNRSWLEVFKANAKEAEEIKEMLRALVLTYENPSIAELVILAGLRTTEEEKTYLQELVDKCKPLLSTKSETIGFMNSVVKDHLLDNSKDLLGLSKEETKWQNGVLALRSFSHLKELYGSLPPEPLEEPEGNDETAEDATKENDAEDQDDDANNGIETGTVRQSEHESEVEADDDENENEDEDEEDDEDEEEEEEEEEDEDDAESVINYVALPYMIKYWLRHASKATLDIAEDLSLEVDFWKAGSFIRRKWLEEYCHLVPTFDDFDRTTLTGLHVAASLGFKPLVAALIRNSDPENSEIKTRDSLVNTPLHFAAFFGRSQIVEELLNRGAPIDDGIEDAEQTPLHMAAFGGHTEVMKKLVMRGAKADATACDIGPVVSAAICSGNRDAVELLVEHGVSLTTDKEDVASPLALAALLADISMFEYLINQYADKLPAVEYSKALVSAAEAGKIDVLTKLLEFQHTEQYFQSALNAAVEEWNWDVVTILLQRCPGLDCNGLFLAAATCSEPQDKMLEICWEYANGSITAETLGQSLYEATDTEKESTVEMLLTKFRADPNAKGEEYGNALTAAAYDGTIDIVKMLLNAGANVNDPEGYAIQAAAAQGHYEVVEELIKQGADVNALTSNENFEEGTALQGATEASQTDIVRLLLDSGANPDLGSGTCSPPIIAATRGDEVDILDMLIRAKSTIDVLGGPERSTPLINAASFMPVSSIEQLLAAGADINLADEDGDTALVMASSHGEPDAVKCLLANGADIMQSSPGNGTALEAALENDNTDCLELLVEHTSVIFKALKRAMDSGNPAVTSIIRSATNDNQGLNYDDDNRPETQHSNRIEANGDMNEPETRSLGHHDNHNGVNGSANEVPVNPSNGISRNWNAQDDEQSELNYMTDAVPAELYRLNNQDDEQSRDVSGAVGYREDQHNFLEGDQAASEGSDHADSNGGSDRFESEAPTEVPTDDDATDAASFAASSMYGDRSEADDSSLDDGAPNIPDPVTQLTEQLQSALDNQPLALQYDRADAPLNYNEHTDPLRGRRQQNEAGLFDDSPILPRDSSHGPAELPSQTLMRRKPAPLGNISRQSQTPSPRTLDTGYQAPSTSADYDARTPTAPYHPGQQQQQHHQQEQAHYDQLHDAPAQAPIPVSSIQEQPTGHQTMPSSSSAAPYQNMYRQSYQPSQPAQTAPAATMTGYPPQQQKPQYQAYSSQYGAPETHYVGQQGIQQIQQQQQQAYTAYNPNMYQQSQPQVYAQQAYAPEQDEKYQSYYASLQAAQQQQEQQQQQFNNEPGSWDNQPLALKPQRSSFFTGGVKNTFGKAKIVGNGILNRKNT
ncbi:ankyrin repeat-containing domain protein [Astrocystis sublimbata]|nr:ankyrin repeat-containing domain protein [Astrocystis sublimbata]